MKVKGVIRDGVGDKGKGGREHRVTEKVNMNKISYVHVLKCHNETYYLVQLIYTEKGMAVQII
jgi:hypothetical protein